MRATESLYRRDVLALVPSMALAAPLVACDQAPPWHDIDVSGTSPSLSFTLRRAPDGKLVTQADMRGKIVMLYFGYTFCPDVCPLTLQNVNQALTRLGPAASEIRFLFVTVDPNRDSLNVLGQYMSLFGPNFVGLRGTPDQLARLAQRYRVAYSVTPPGNGHGYEVIHSAVIYVFDQSGAAKLLVPSMASQTPDIDGLAEDLQRLTRSHPTWLGKLEALV
ncbi:SCO family protein [Acidisoma sp. L85]|uniref:SCO family protein n=1 Tax=Acidisoma sp. L85 TaxID=1641850 RepID=UPI00131E9079|nr:SCO family protein [Acidisoma sp. L85]